MTMTMTTEQRSAAILTRLKYDVDTYRPVGWPYPPSMSFERVVEMARIASAKSARKEALKDEDSKAIAAMTMLRDCYVTDEWVWRLASLVAGKARGTWDCDPYFNAWSYTKEWLVENPLVLDGFEGRDGLAKDPDDKPSFWTGDCLVNGPHSVTEKWISLAAMHGRENIVAAVVQVSGQKWLMKHGMQCDVCIELGRMNYVSPRGLPPAKCNPLGSALLLWLPELRKPRAKKFAPTIYSVVDRYGKEHRCLARAGCGGPKTPVIKVPEV